MENSDAGPSNSGRSPSPESPNPIDQLHPVLRRLIERMIDLPKGHEALLTERRLTLAVECAITMMPEDEQAYLVSHIMTDDDIIQETLESLDLGDLDQRVLFSAAEKQFLLRNTPEPDSNENDSGGERYGNGGTCKICLMDSDSILTCGCHYCSGCLKWTIRIGLQSIHDFPPHCCFDFDENLIRVVDRPGLVHLYRQVAVEKATPLRDRLYCFDTRCSAFIPPWLIEAALGVNGGDSGVGTCPQCAEETCATCRGKSHRGLPCGDKKEEEAVLDMMDQEGLVYCPGCGRTLASAGGCNIMK